MAPRGGLHEPIEMLGEREAVGSCDLDELECLAFAHRSHGSHDRTHRGRRRREEQIEAEPLLRPERGAVFGPYELEHEARCRKLHGDRIDAVRSVRE